MKSHEQKNKQSSIALVLGSGAARGLTHIGVLKAIEELGIKIDYICGCSIGALIGGAYAMGMPIREIDKIARQTNWKLMAKIFSPSLSFSAFANDKYLMEFLNTYFEGVNFDSLNLPFSTVASDIESGEMVVIEEGDLVSAIRASASIPLLFSPVQFGKRKLVDGGLINPTPVDVANSKKFDKIIAVNLRGFKPAKFFTEINEISSTSSNLENYSLNEKIEYFMKHPREFFSQSKNSGKAPKPKFGSVLYQMFLIVQTQIAELNLKNNPPDILIQPDTHDFKMFDFNKADALIKIGYDEAIKQLPTESL